MHAVGTDNFARNFQKQANNWKGVKRHMKQRSTSLTVRGNANQDYNGVSPHRGQKGHQQQQQQLQKSASNKCWRGCGEKGTSLHCWQECEHPMDREAGWATVHGIERVGLDSVTKPQPLWRRVWKFLKKTKIRATRWPNPNPRIAQQLKNQVAQRKPTPHSLFHSLLVTWATFNIHSMFRFSNLISLHGFPLNATLQPSHLAQFFSGSSSTTVWIFFFFFL